VKRLLLSVLVIVLGYWTTPGSARFVPDDDQRVVRVMTRNVYHGVDAEIFAVGGATSGLDLATRVTAVYDGYLLRNFPARAVALAAEVDRERPDLIGLQEAMLIRKQLPGDGQITPNATTVVLDYVELLLDALAARGLSYYVAVQSINFDVELPSLGGFDVRHTVRDVILARSNVSTSGLKLSNPQSGHFVKNCAIPTILLGPIPVLRGWVSIDGKIRGQRFRFVSTHLDGDCASDLSIQQAQAQEVLDGPGTTDLPLVLAGDFNSPADGSGVTYNNLIGSGFSDAWTLAGAGAGFSCCQADDLLNPISMLDRRIDFVLFRGRLRVQRAVIVGDDPAARVSGLWPSDHAGFVVALTVPED
jgi:endonuclease/exonuclease/phosphatase family metal-dependent hydrolase